MDDVESQWEFERRSDMEPENRYDLLKSNRELESGYTFPLVDPIFMLRRARAILRGGRSPGSNCFVHSMGLVAAQWIHVFVPNGSFRGIRGVCCRF